MQDTDSLMLKAFVERGGTVLLFGPRIPFGDGFDRDALVGGKERRAARHERVEIREPLFVRAGRGARFSPGPQARVSWDTTTARSAAAFEDGSAAVLVNSVGRGAVISVPFSLAEASVALPGLVRDILDFALARHDLKRPFDIDGVDGDMDVTVATGDGERAAVVMNYGSKPVEIAISLRDPDPGRSCAVTDLRTGARSTLPGKGLSPWRTTVPGHGFIAVRFKAE